MWQLHFNNSYIVVWAANCILRLNEQSVSVFSGPNLATWHLQERACRISCPPAELIHPHNNSISDHWNWSAFSCYSEDGPILTPSGSPCQSREWPVWVIYTLPRVSECHVARKWHITAANHAAAKVTWATVRAVILKTNGKRGLSGCLSWSDL